MAGLYAPLRDFCRAERDWLIETTTALARLESPTNDKAAVDRCGADLASRLERAGGRVTRLSRSDRGDHLLAEFGCGSSQVLLLGHFDTVWPVGHLERMPLVCENGRLHGPGVYDMKAGIGVGLLAVRALIETGAPLARRIVMLWTSDEEMGSATSREAVEEEAGRSEAVLVLEPALPGGAVKTARKGCGSYELIVRGVAAHAGVDPEKGASAVHEIARQILRVQALDDAARGISIQVTRVAGGHRTNVIPDEASAMVDIRVPTAAEAQRIDEALHALVPGDPRTTLEVAGGLERPPMERSAGVARLYDRARQIARELGRELAEGATGGGSDGNFTAALGVPTLDGLGAIGGGAHALHEYVEVDALSDRAALVAGLMLSL